MAKTTVSVRYHEGPKLAEKSRICIKNATEQIRSSFEQLDSCWEIIQRLRHSSKEQDRDSLRVPNSRGFRSNRMLPQVAAPLSEMEFGGVSHSNEGSPPFHDLEV